MNTLEIFPYDLENGSVVDFVRDRFILAIKDDFWSDEELALLKEPMQLHFCYTNDLAIFVLEGGPIDSGDFYFNVQECDDATLLFEQDLISLEVVFLNAANQIVWKKRVNFSREDSRNILYLLEGQSKTEFMDGEYDVNVEGIQSAYQPYDLVKFAKASLKI